MQQLLPCTTPRVYLFTTNPTLYLLSVMVGSPPLSSLDEHYDTTSLGFLQGFLELNLGEKDMLTMVRLVTLQV